MDLGRRQLGEEPIPDVSGIEDDRVVRSSPFRPVSPQNLSSPHTPSPPRTARQRLSHACLNLSPSIFSLNMGTGIASILLYNFPYSATWLQRLGIVVFVLNTVSFVVVSGLTVARYVLWKGIFTVLAEHVAGLYWGCLPMGLVTIVNMIAFVCVPAWGYNWAKLALGLWWIDVVISILCNFGLLFMIFTRQTHTQDTVSAPFLLPIVTSVVAAASGGIIAQHLVPFNPHLARSTVICSYVMFGTGVPNAMFIIALWIQGMITSPRPRPVSMPGLFLPLGPCGQGAYGVVLLGRVVRDLAYDCGLGLAATTTETTSSTLFVADAVYAGGIVTGLILWGLGFVWYSLAMIITLDHGFRNPTYFHHSSFSLGWTAYTFPIGVFATATNILAEELASSAFKVLGTLVSVQVILQWLYVFVMACWKIWDGSVLVAAELERWDGEPPRRWPRERQTGSEK